MNIEKFELERFQSLYENTVEFNLTESGFHPYSLKELLTPEQLDIIQNLTLGYGQTNGSIELRETLTQYYKGSSIDNFLITSGSGEANFVACHTVLDPGDEIVIMLPNYMQIWGIVKEIGCIPKAFHLKEEHDWSPDLSELRRNITSKTKAIAVCNPNNPTGYTLTKAEMTEIVAIASQNDCWILSDEVYRGAELDGNEVDSFWGMYDKVIVTGGLSKAFALPGLRLGWLAGPKATIEEAWSYHDYTSITASILSHKVAEFALAPSKKAEILDRNRSMLKQNLSYLQQWIDAKEKLFRFIPPKAGGMSFVKYFADGVNSSDLAEFLRINYSILIVPGDCYGMDGYIRLGIGERKDYLLAGLERLNLGIEAYLSQTQN